MQDVITLLLSVFMSIRSSKNSALNIWSSREVLIGKFLGARLFWFVGQSETRTRICSDGVPSQRLKIWHMDWMVICKPSSTKTCHAMLRWGLPGPRTVRRRLQSGQLISPIYSVVWWRRHQSQVQCSSSISNKLILSGRQSEITSFTTCGRLDSKILCSTNF